MALRACARACANRESWRRFLVLAGMDDVLAHFASILLFTAWAAQSPAVRPPSG